MKKILHIILLLVIMASVSSCKEGGVKYAETFEYYNTEDKSVNLVVSFYNKDMECIAENAKIKIEIINESGKTVYNHTIIIAKDDYAISQTDGTISGCVISISDEEIEKGSDYFGTAYITMKVGFKSFEFEKDISGLPLEREYFTVCQTPVTVKSYMFGYLAATVVIDEIRIEYDEEHCHSNAYLSGRMEYVLDDEIVILIKCEVQNEACETVYSASVFVPMVMQGERFTDCKCYLPSLDPGEHYNLVFTTYDSLSDN